MRTVILVPRRNDQGHRDRLWALCRKRWQALFPELPIYEGHHDEGSFNRGAAINLAARLADADGRWDVAVIVDSDVMVRRSQVLAAVARAQSGYVTWAHLRWREFSDYWTGRTLADGRIFGPEFEGVDLDVLVGKTTPISWSCCIAVPRTTWDEMGGFDERFRGWGYEDGAWESLVRGLYQWDRITVVPGDEDLDVEHQRKADVINLAHPRSAERIEEGKNLSTAPDDYIRNGLLGRRYQIAVKRDHGLGDQVGEDAMSPALVATHIANLKRSDQRFLQEAVRRGMPEAAWKDWWPTLEELRAGALDMTYGPVSEESRITVIVTSGGPADKWPIRRDYLRDSLRSLTERVTGPIVQRVVYSDWGEDLKPEVEAIAHEFGFYVSGEGHHGHTGMRKRMWKYLSRHALGNYVFATEDDFLYERDVNIRELMAPLLRDRNMVQVALLRDACYGDEKELEAIGNILGHPRPAFIFRPQWMEHRLFWTNNPSVFRIGLTVHVWPETQENPRTGRGRGSEVIFGEMLTADPGVRFAFWGQGEAWVRHIGQVRAGVGY